MSGRMTIQKWYNSSVAIPGRTSSHYNSFLASCIGIVNSIVEDNIGKRIQVRFVNGGTASADVKEKVLRINYEFVKGTFDPSSPPVDNHTTIAAILGIITHEAGHFAWTKEGLLPYVEHIQKNTSFEFNRDVAATLGNVIEDVYIEAEIDRVVPSLTWTLDTINDLMFDDSSVARTLIDAKPYLGAPQNLVQVGKLLNLLILAKTQKYLELNPFQQKLFDLVSSATELFRQKERSELALEVYEQLMAEVNGESPECEYESGAEQSGEEVVAEAKENSKGFTASHDESEPVVRDTPSTMETLRINNILGETDDAQVTSQAVSNADTGRAAPTTIFIEKRIPLGEQHLEMDERYAKLAEIGRQRATVNRPYGEDRQRGTNIRKLYRIATDNKIFAQPLAIRSYKPMQVIVLVDCSGSMEATVGEGTRKMAAPTRVHLALKAALGAAYGLANARCDVAVYGHTAEYLGGTEVVIYKAKDFSDSLDNLSARLSRIEESEKLWQNRDGYAIGYVAKKFTDKRKRRLLIVISDGAPEAGYGYEGYTSQQHTQQVVEEVRRTGVEVLSISITESANYANEEIYGHKWNVANEDVNVIEDVIRKLIVQ